MNLFFVCVCVLKSLAFFKGNQYIDIQLAERTFSYFIMINDENNILYIFQLHFYGKKLLSNKVNVSIVLNVP